MNFIFVILHYLTWEDTLEAVNSIRLYEPNSRIIIVDNASNNGSLEILRNNLDSDKLIDIITSPYNVGFAKGNNLGITFALDNYKPDFICLMNNDVVLIESICESIQNEFYKSHFSVMGPMIYTADGHCDDNPGVNAPMTADDLSLLIKTLKKDILINKLHLSYVYRLLKKFQRELLLKKENVTQKSYLERTENVQLHGCFLIFSAKYFDVFKGLYPNTFLNLEEDILFWQVINTNLKSVYSPSIHVYHKEDSASKKMWPRERKRTMAKLQNMLDSSYAFKELMLSSERKYSNRSTRKE